ncbi:GAF domain-containing protein [Sphingobium sp. 3R8]|uniref:GAF domain-containing protein n=1 Tax=Sphingobium sp. 3R8 TaxID=2874921 RepID=UPI001CCC4924|nr:GAF domain-containing protein [Sphingobium sp. 3R8]MBZ9646646.1 GAF domain-containing protein [Sphingobium sp. 3R8]
MTHGSSSADPDASGAQSFLIEASEQLAAARSMAEVVDVLRRTARSAIGAEGIAIILKDGDLCHYVAEDAIGPLWSGKRFPADSCVSGWAMRHARTVAIADIERDDRVPQDAYRPTFVRSLVSEQSPVATLGAPARQGGFSGTVLLVDDEDVVRASTADMLATSASTCWRRAPGAKRSSICDRPITSTLS